MILVEVKVIDENQYGLFKTIADIQIENVRTDITNHANYDVHIRWDRKNGRLSKRLKIEKFDRDKGALELIKLVLVKMTK